MNTTYRKTIMLIDDSSTNNFLHKSILIEEGFNVLTYSDGASALAKLHNFLPDLIVLDLIMPVMDGFMFLNKKKLLKQAVHIPVIVLTSQINEENEKNARKMGAVDFMIKPVGIRPFIEKVQNALLQSTAIHV